MLRKQPPKRTPVTGPSGHGEGPSDVVEGLLSDPLDVRNLLDPLDMPRFEGKDMTVTQFQVFYAAWNWYLVELRQLLPEEVQDMAAIYCGTDYPTRKAIELHNRLANPRYSVAIDQALRHLTGQERQRLIDKAKELFEELTKEPEAQARSEDLKGFRGRLTLLPYSKTNSRALGTRFLRHAQFYLLYVFGNWLKNSEDNGITDFEVERIIDRLYNYNVRTDKFSKLLKDLRDPNHTLHKSISIVLMEPRHREFFGNKALELYNDYAGKQGLPDAHLDIPTEDEGEPEPTTTTSMETLSLTTTAPSSSGPTALGPSEDAELDTPPPDNDSEFFDNAFYERRFMEASPSPSGAGSKNVSNKSKGKGRERQSDSPGEGSGKAGGKKPRRQGK